MSPFLLSMIFGFILYAVVRFTQISSNSEVIRIQWLDSIRLSISEPARTMIAMLLAVILTIAIISIGVAYVHVPDRYYFKIVDVGLSRNSMSVVFGFGLGLITAHVILRLLRKDDSYQFTSKDWLAVGCIAFLLVFGMSGEKAVSDMITRVNEVSFGGAKLGLTATPQRTMITASGPATLPTGTASSAVRANGSQGLANLAQLGEIIDRDSNYLDLISAEGDNRKTLRDRLELHRKVLSLTIVPIAGCLLSLYKSSADAEELHERVAAIAQPLKTLITDRADYSRAFSIAVKDLAREANLVVVEAYRSSLMKVMAPREPSTSAGATGGETEARSVPKSDIFVGCQNLIAAVCMQKTLTQWATSDLDAAADCLAKRAAVIDADSESDPSKARTKKDSKDAIALSDFENVKSNFVLLTKNDPRGTENLSFPFNNLPYMVIAYADLAAQLKQYQAAVFAIDKYIERNNAFPGDIRNWIQVRTRTSLAQVVQEWIDTRDIEPSSAVLPYHINNIEKIIQILDAMPFMNEIAMQTGKLSSSELGDLTATPDDAGVCAVRPEFAGNAMVASRISALLETYVGMYNSYVESSLRSAERARLDSGRIASRADRVRSLRLTCISQKHRSTIRAEVLMLWARSEANLAQLGTDIKGLDWSRTRWSSALDAARLAEIEIQDDYEKDQNHDGDKEILERIQESELLGLHGKIRSIQTEVARSLAEAR